MKLHLAVLSILLAGCVDAALNPTVQHPSPAQRAAGLQSLGSSGGIVGRVLGADGRPAANIDVQYRAANSLPTEVAKLVGNNAAALVSNNSGGLVITSPYRILTGFFQVLASADPGSVETDADGQFAIAPTFSGPANLSAQRASDPAFAAWKGSVTFQAGSVSQIGDMQLAPTGRISGSVLADNVSDYTGTRVYIPGSSYGADVDRGGNYTIDHVPANADGYILLAYSPELGEAAIPNEITRRKVVVASGQTAAADSLVLKIQPPQILKITMGGQDASIAKANIGDSIDIHGQNFGYSKGLKIAIHFSGANGFDGRADRVSDNLIRVHVPSDATIGDLNSKVSVEVGNIYSDGDSLEIGGSSAGGNPANPGSGNNPSSPGQGTGGSTGSGFSCSFCTSSGPTCTYSQGCVTSDGHALRYGAPILNGVTFGPCGDGCWINGQPFDQVGGGSPSNPGGGLPSSPGGGSPSSPGSSDGTGSGLAQAPATYVDPQAMLKAIAYMGPAGNRSGFAGVGLGTIYGLAISPRGTPWISDTGHVQAGRLDIPNQAFQGDIANGVWPSVTLASPRGLAFSLNGQYVYLADGEDNGQLHDLIWKSPDFSWVNGTPAVYAGQAGGGYRNGAASSALFKNPTGLAVGPDGSVFVADTDNHCIRQISPDGNTVGTYAGADPTVAAGARAGFADGVATSARFNRPMGLAYDPNAQMLYVADTGNNAIRAIDQFMQVSTLVGRPDNTPGPWTPLLPGFMDAMDAPNNTWPILPKLSGPAAVAALPDQNLVVADTDSHTIRVLKMGAASPGRMVAHSIETLFGNPFISQPVPPGDSNYSPRPDGAYLSQPTAICVDTHSNTIWVGDSGLHAIFSIQPSTQYGRAY